jgi:hypothetical protein
VAAAALVALIPHVPAPGASLRDQTRLTLELGTTSVVLIVQVFAGVTAVFASSPEGDRGQSPEILAAPTSRARSTIARLFGIWQVAALLLGALVAVMLATWTPAGVPLSDLARMAPPLTAALAGAVAFAALGIAFGRAARPDLAVLLVVVLPLIPPACAATNAPRLVLGALSATLPPIAGPIHARPYAFGGEVAALSDTLSTLAALAQAAAWTTLAASATVGARSRTQESRNPL